MRFQTSYFLFAGAVLARSVLGRPSNGSFPAVDLGYAVHVPTAVKEADSGMSYANYNNIRFAEPPLGQLRFRRPAPPLPQDGIQNGSANAFSVSCVSAYPPEFPFEMGNSTAWGQEDCLFLNVRVPEGIKPGEKVPVLHLFHGSGYGVGSKDINLDSVGVYNELHPPTQKFIQVSSNYRMGLYGWTSSPDEDMDANVGLYDAMAAMEWTKDHISKFGGDPERITAMGESAGAGLVTLMLTSYGGKGTLPFQQAFISSPGIWPRREPSRRQALYEEVLETAGCDSLDCLRNASEEVLFKSNTHLIRNRTSDEAGSFGPGIGFTPVVDGDLIPDLVNVLLTSGRFHTEINQVVTGNMIEEAAVWALNLSMPEEFPSIVRDFIPGADDTTVERIKSLYDVPAENPDQLAWDWYTDVIFACNSYHTAQAYGDKAGRYYMSTPPAFHGLDVLHYFYINDKFTPVANVPLARQFQEYLRRFITHSENPSDHLSQIPEWPSYGGPHGNASSFNITAGAFEQERDEWDRSGRCEVLNDIISDPRNGA